MRRFVVSAALAACAVVAGCAALAEDGWSPAVQVEPVEPIATPSIPEAREPVGERVLDEDHEPPLEERVHAEQVEPAPPARTAEGCVADPIADAVEQWPAEHVDVVTVQELSLWPLPDVDGDGLGESMVVAEVHCGVTGNCPRLLYLSHDGCPRYGGGLWATSESERVLPKVRHGVHDLEVYLKGGCGGMEGTVYRLGWTGDRYRVRSTIDCACEPEWSESEVADAVARGERDPACPG